MIGKSKKRNLLFLNGKDLIEFGYKDVRQYRIFLNIFDLEFLLSGEFVKPVTIRENQFGQTYMTKTVSLISEPNL